MFHILSNIETSYIQGALRQMQLVANLLDHFKKIEMQYIPIFGFIILNLPVYYTALCTKYKTEPRLSTICILSVIIRMEINQRDIILI